MASEASACSLYHVEQSTIAEFNAFDEKAYLDTSFFRDLEQRFGACDIGSKTCQFWQAYVIAHEIGHHVQNVLGLLPQVEQAQRAMSDSFGHWR